MIMVRTDRVPGALQGITLLLLCTMAVMAVVALTAVVPQMMRHFKDVPNSDYLVGLILTIPSMFFFLFAPVAGWIADRFGRRPILIGGLIVYAAVGIVPTFIENIYGILISRCGVGICEAIILTVSTTMICDYFQGHSRERWLAGQTAVSQVAAIVIIFAGGQLGAVFGWYGPFYLYLSSLLLAAAVYFFTWEPVKRQYTAAQVTTEDALYKTLPWPRLLGICALSVVASVMFFSILIQNGNALAALGVSAPAKVGAFTSVATMGAVLGAFIYWRAARLPTAWLLLVDFLIIGTGYSMMGRATDPLMYTAAGFFCNIGMGMVLPTLLVWATRGLAYDIRGRGNGIWQSAFLIGQFLAGVTVPLIARLHGGVLPAFVLLGYAALAIAAMAFLASTLWRQAEPGALH
jgi:MFS family permease